MYTSVVVLVGIFVSGLLLRTGSVYAQEERGPEAILTGQVVDAESGDPLIGATVALWEYAEDDSTLVTGTVTDSSGTFEFDELPRDAFTLRVSYVGYESVQRTDTRPALAEGEGDLGTLALAPQPTETEGVEVTADRPAAQIQTDRTVYNTADRAVSAGGTARTVLENLPSIEVDVDGDISFRGNENVAIHVNGEPASLSGESLIGYLQSLPAGAVQRVEVIPNPSARYEPEGMAGIINIVLRRDVDAGWGGGLTLSGQRDANAKYGGSGSINATYQSGDWRLITSYSHRRDESEDTSERFRRIFASTESDEVERREEQSGLEDEYDLSHSVSAEIEHQWTDQTSLTLDNTLSYRTEDVEERITYRDEPNGDASPDRYARLIAEEQFDRSLDTRLSLNHDIVPDEHTVEAEVRYDWEIESESGTYREHPRNGNDILEDQLRSDEAEELNETEQDGSFELDYTRPLGPLTLETGYKGTFRRLDSDQLFQGRTSLGDPLEERSTNAFVFDEVINAGYGILKKEWEQFGIEGGLRGEHVRTNFDLESREEPFDNQYVSLYPSAFFNYSPNERRQMRLSYSKRVNRPGLWNINPLDDNSDPNTRWVGNPALDPEYIHSFEFTATQRWKVGSLSASPYLRHTVNEIEFIETLEDGVSVLRFENVASSTSYGTELIGTVHFGDRLQGTLSGNLYRVVTDASNLNSDLSEDALAISTRANLRSKLRDGLQLELSQFYRPAMDVPGGRRGRFLRTTLALKQDVFAGNGSLAVRVDDVFNTQSFEIRRETDIFYQESTIDWSTREVSLTFQYTFGNTPDDRGGRGRGGGDFGGGGAEGGMPPGGG